MAFSVHLSPLKLVQSGLEGYRFETHLQQGLFTAESPLEICPSSHDLYTQYNSSVRFIG